jgi:ATP synthase protein I
MFDKTQVKSLMRAGAVGINLVATSFVGLAIGYYLDKWLGTKPWLTFVFFFIGLATGFREVFRLAKGNDKKDMNDKEDS